jgi:hypothetical protein
MALKLVKEAETQLTPHRAALAANLQAIKDTRSKVMVIVEKDRQAAADIALAEATQGRIQTMQEAIDTARAEAAYAGDPPPDVKHLEKQLADAHQLHKSQSDRARAAANVRVKYTADMAALNSVLSAHARDTKRLLWVAMREDVLAGLAEEFLAKEAAFLDVNRRVFGAAVACDAISMEQAYGQFVRSGNLHDLNISRPEHPAFVGEPLTVEQAQQKRREYIHSIVLESDLLTARLMEQ